MFGRNNPRSTLAQNLKALAKLDSPTWQIGVSRSFVEEAAIRIASSLVTHPRGAVDMDQSQVVQRSVSIAKGLAKELGVEEKCS